MDDDDGDGCDGISPTLAGAMMIPRWRFSRSNVTSILILRSGGASRRRDFPSTAGLFGQPFAFCWVALGRNSDQRNELTKDVSAFANSAGGQIVYGTVEVDHKRFRVDAGSNPARISREWIEQIIDSNVQPRIDGLVIQPISLFEGNFAYVIDIPQAITRAPHQASDKKYYRRQNFQSVPMEDYEIRDIFRRATYAEPFATISFSNRRTTIDVELEHGSDHSAPIDLIIALGNRSSQPAYYSIFYLYIDRRVVVASKGELQEAGQGPLNNGQIVYVYIMKMGIPEAFPLFKETNFALSGTPFSFKVPYGTLHEDRDFIMGKDVAFLFGYDIRTPGYHVNQWGKLRLYNGRLEIRLEPPTINR